MKTGRWLIVAAVIAAVGIAALALAGCNKSDNSNSNHNEHAKQYTCSMHPEVVQDKPGDCPKCGMKLVEKH